MHRIISLLILTASACFAALPEGYLPRVVELGNGTAARINRIDGADIGYDLGTVADLVSFVATDTGRGAPPLPGFDPATAEAWPSDAVLIEQINNPPIVASAAPTWTDAGEGNTGLVLAVDADSVGKFTADVGGYSAKAVAGDLDLDTETTVIRDATSTEHTLTIRAYLRLIGRLHDALRASWEAAN